MMMETSFTMTISDAATTRYGDAECNDGLFCTGTETCVGGSCVAGPDGQWVLEPQVEEEGLYVVEIDRNEVARERQNFDVAGHYSRPDVTRLKVSRKRQKTVVLED